MSMSSIGTTREVVVVTNANSHSCAALPSRRDERRRESARRHEQLRLGQVGRRHDLGWRRDRAQHRSMPLVDRGMHAFSGCCARDGDGHDERERRQLREDVGRATVLLGRVTTC